MSEANFINEIEFQEGKENLFPPFKGGDKIFLGGEKEVENLIKFYLKNKGIENWEDNAKRFKINCVLGNNGGGKSRLFEGIVNKYEKLKIENIDDKEIILDDFFIFGKHFKNKKNINYYLYKFLGANIKLDSTTDRHIFIYNYIVILNYFFENYYKFTLLNSFKNKVEKKVYIKPKGELLFKKKFIENNTNIQEALGYTEYSLKFYEKIINKVFNFLIDTNNQEIKNDDSFKILKYIIFNFLQFKFGTTGKKVYDKLDLDKEINSDEIILNDKDNDFFEVEKGKFFKSKEAIIDDFLDFICKNIKFSIEELVILAGFLADIFYIIDIKFDGKEYRFNDFSAGEKVSFIRFTNIYMGILENYKDFKGNLKNTGKTEEKIEKASFKIIILIDEPDLHLHLDWQKQYIQKLIDVFSTLDTNIKLHFIIATHSPFIISDLPTESIVVLDGKEGITKIKTYDGKKEHKYFENLEEYFKDNKWNKLIDYINKDKYCKLKRYFELKYFEKYNKNSNKKTFGANFVDIIRDGFFFENKVLMGSFAENIIGKIADLEREEIFLKSKLFDIELKLKNKEFKNIDGENKLKKEKENLEKELNKVERKIGIARELGVKEKIGDDFVKENLLYFVKNN